MQIPLVVTFDGVNHSAALEAAAAELAGDLDRFGRVTGCTVTFSLAHQHRQTHRPWEVHLRVRVPGTELVSNRHRGEGDEDPYVALRHAFDAMRRQLEDYTRRRDEGKRQVRSGAP